MAKCSILSPPSKKQIFFSKRLFTGLDKFPQDRNIVLAPEVAARIHAQEQAGHLVFEADIGVTEVKGP